MGIDIKRPTIYGTFKALNSLTEKFFITYNITSMAIYKEISGLEIILQPGYYNDLGVDGQVILMYE